MKLNQLVLFLLCCTNALHTFAQEKIDLDINGIKMQFVTIPAGEFIMGDKDGQRDERPRHPVSIDSFYMQTTEITVEQFDIFANATNHPTNFGCWYFNSGWLFSAELNWRNPGYPQQPNHPAVCISWNDTQQFITWLNQQQQEYRFRLPTEAEWEYAARAGSHERYYWGSDPSGLCTHANASDKQTLKHFPSFRSNDCDDGYVETSPVGNYLANSYGLFDVYGNAWEWTQDCWHESYSHAPEDGSAWEGNCMRRVFRGGGWGDNPKFARSGLRNRTEANKHKDDIGFRLVLEIINNKPDSTAN